MITAMSVMRERRNIRETSAALRRGSEHGKYRRREFVERVIRENTRLIYIETRREPDPATGGYPGIAVMAKKAGIPLAVDSTWVVPAFKSRCSSSQVCYSQRDQIPEGHGDALGGLIVGPGKIFIEFARMRWYTRGAMSPLTLLILAGYWSPAAPNEKAFRQRRHSREIPRGASGRITSVLSRPSGTSAI